MTVDDYAEELRRRLLEAGFDFNRPEVRPEFQEGLAFGRWSADVRID